MVATFGLLPSERQRHKVEILTPVAAHRLFKLLSACLNLRVISLSSLSLLPAKFNNSIFFIFTACVVAKGMLEIIA
jgi:hypothetical protein